MEVIDVEIVASGYELILSKFWKLRKLRSPFGFRLNWRPSQEF